MYHYHGSVERLRLISKFPKEALAKLPGKAEWAAQLLIISRWFSTPEGDWMRCCDVDADHDDPNIFIEVVVGGSGPVTLKSASSKDLIAGRIFLNKDVTYDYNIESPAPLQLVYSCNDIYTKPVKGKDYLRRHLHIEKGGRLLWNLQRAQFVEIIPDMTMTVGEAMALNCDCPYQDEQFVHQGYQM